jgi:hypothetical protein
MRDLALFEGVWAVVGGVVANVAGSSAACGTLSAQGWARVAGARTARVSRSDSNRPAAGVG